MVACWIKSCSLNSSSKFKSDDMKLPHATKYTQKIKHKHGGLKNIFLAKEKKTWYWEKKTLVKSYIYKWSCMTKKLSVQKMLYLLEVLS